jgi:hypothetical protein
MPVTEIRSFTDIPEISFEEAVSKVTFQTEREQIIAAGGQYLNRMAIYRSEDPLRKIEKKLLGSVPDKRIVDPHYPGLIETVAKSFEDLNLGNKIIHVSLNKREDMIVNWLVDLQIRSPDNLPIFGFFRIQSSYIGHPLGISLGTYRLVCQNGAYVVKSQAPIIVKAKTDLSDLEYPELIGTAVKGIEAISTSYELLGSIELRESFPRFLKTPYVATSLKKEVIGDLSKRGIISQRDSEDKLNSENFITRGEHMFDVHQNLPSWDLYNSATFVATHLSKNFSANEARSWQIANFFGV